MIEGRQGLPPRVPIYVLSITENDNHLWVDLIVHQSYKPRSILGDRGMVCEIIGPKVHDQ